MAAAAMLCRRSLGQRMLPLALGFSIGHFVVTRRPLRLDAFDPHASASPPRPPVAAIQKELDDGFINPDVLRQISGGSLTGLITGVLVSVFSRTLVLLIGLTIITFEVAARYGIDLGQQLRLKERINSSRILSALRDKTPLKLSFGLTFAMSAFMSF